MKRTVFSKDKAESAANLQAIADDSEISCWRKMKVGERLTVKGAVYVFQEYDETGGLLCRAKIGNKAAIFKEAKLLKLWNRGDAYIGDYDGHLTLRQTELRRTPLDALPATTQMNICRDIEYLEKFQSDLSEGKILSSGIKHWHKWLNSFDPLPGWEKHPSAGAIQKKYYRWKNSNFANQVLAHGNALTTRKSSLHPAAEEALEKVLREVFLPNQSFTAEELKRLITDELESLNADIKESDENWIHAPSESTINRRKACLDPYDLVSNKYGKFEADARFGIVGTLLKKGKPFGVWQIDHSVLKIPIGVKLVDEFGEEHSLKLGHCWVTCIVDVFSGLVLSAVVGMHPPSTLRVIEAIKQALLPSKREDPLALKPQGVHGIPELIVMDNGLDFHAFQLENMLANLRIKVVYARAYRGSDKPNVERLFRTVKSDLYRWLDIDQFTEQCTTKPVKGKKQPPLLSEEFVAEVFADWVRLYNARGSKHRNNHSPMSPMASGLKKLLSRPAKNAGSTYRSIESIESGEFHRAMCLNLILKFGKKGVRYKYLYFINTRLADFARNNHGKPVKVRLDPTNVGSIQFLDERPSPEGGWYTVPNSAPEYAEGLTLEVHQKIRAHTNRYLKECEPESLKKDFDYARLPLNNFELMNKIFNHIGKDAWGRRKEFLAPTLMVNNPVDLAIATRRLDQMEMLAGRAPVGTPMRTLDYKKVGDHHYSYEPDAKKTKKWILSQYQELLEEHSEEPADDHENQSPNPWETSDPYAGLGSAPDA